MNFLSNMAENFQGKDNLSFESHVEHVLFPYMWSETRIPPYPWTKEELLSMTFIPCDKLKAKKMGSVLLESCVKE